MESIRIESKNREWVWINGILEWKPINNLEIEREPIVPDCYSNELALKVIKCQFIKKKENKY
jgi:hypothetical protein